MFSRIRSQNDKPLVTLKPNQLKELDLLKSKVNNQYKIVNTKCPICNSTNGKTLSLNDRYGFAFNQIICECGLVYANPRYDKDSYKDFYTNHYYNLYGMLDAHEYFDQEEKQGKSIFDFIVHALPDSKDIKILEVGSGAGGILSYFRNLGYKNLRGLEYDRKYIKFSREKGLNITFGNIFEISNEDKFDLIIYSHVFEHLLDLEKELNEIKKKLNKNGILYIEVPSILKLKDYYYDIGQFIQNAHTYNFTKNSLKNITGKHGFSVIKINDFVKGLFKLGESSKIIFDNNVYNKILINEIIYIFFGYYSRFLIENFKLFLKKIGLFNLIKSIYNFLKPS